MPPKRSTPKVYHCAGALCKEPTAAEAKLWAHLRGNKLNGINFRRQHAIGKYIVDFCSIKKKLVLELDGNQHLEQEEYDQQRTAFLETQGYSIVRFWNDKVMNDIEGVMHAIVLVLDKE